MTIFNEWARNHLVVALCSQFHGTDVDSVIQADGGTIKTASENKLKIATKSQQAGGAIKTAVNADSALANDSEQRLSAAMGNRAASVLYDAELSA